MNELMKQLRDTKLENRESGTVITQQTRKRVDGGETHGDDALISSAASRNGRFTLFYTRWNAQSPLDNIKTILYGA